MQHTVLNKGWVELQDFMGSDRAIVNAARTSYLGDDRRGDEADKKLLFSLMQRGHTTPFEMVEFKFRVKAPVVVWWQWVRHRTWSFNAQSGRYVEFAEDDFYVPEEWHTPHVTEKQATAGVLNPQEAGFQRHLLLKQQQEGYRLYQQALQMGVAKEQARLFLPAWCSYYIFVCKVDAHNLMNFLHLRMEEHAQWEIRQYANTIFEIMGEKLPWTTEAFCKYRMQ